MSLNKMINRRRSVRRYSGESLSESELQEITQQCMAVKPLYDGIKVKIELADREDIKSMLPFITPKVLCLYSEVKEGYLENAGFVLQQMDLWLQEKGYGNSSTRSAPHLTALSALTYLSKRAGMPRWTKPPLIMQSASSPRAFMESICSL